MTIIAATWMDVITWEHLPIGAKSLLALAMANKRIFPNQDRCPTHKEAIRNYLITRYGENSSEVQKIDSIFNELNWS